MMIINHDKKKWIKAEFCYGDIRKEFFADDLEGYMDGVLHRGDRIVCFGRKGTLLHLTFQKTILLVNILSSPSAEDYQDLKNALLSPNECDGDDICAVIVEKVNINDMFLYGVPMTVTYFHTDN